MVAKNKDLFVGGSFSHIGSVKFDKIARWNGVQWYHVASLNGVVYALNVFEDRLFMGGEFTTCNQQQTLYLAEYMLGDCNSMVDGLNGPVYALSTLGKCLYICGIFSSVGNQQSLYGIQIQNLLRWCVNATSTNSLEAVDMGNMNARACKAISRI